MSNKRQSTGAKLYFESVEFSLRQAMDQLADYTRKRNPLPGGEDDALFEAGFNMVAATEAIKRAHKLLEEGL